MVSGGESDDILFAPTSKYVTPHMYGNGGDDKLYGGGGNDTLDGGTGDDYLQGSSGHDTYVFSRGFGKDTIYNYEYQYTRYDDTIRFTDISLDQIDFKKYDNSNDLTIDCGSDEITLSNWFLKDNYKVDRLVDKSGNTITNSEIDQLVEAMATFNPESGSNVSSITSFEDNTSESLIIAQAI